MRALTRSRLRNNEAKFKLRNLIFENLESRHAFSLGGLLSADPAFNQDPNAYGNFANVDLPMLHSNPTAGAVIYMRFEGGIDDNGDYYAPMDFETKGTSTSTNSYSLGSKTFVTQAGLAFQPGYRIQITNTADPKRYMNAIVTSYSGTSLVVNVDYENSSGSVSNWTITNTHFNSDERDQILDYWRQVSRQYSTFNVDVTTDWIDLQTKPVSYVAITPRDGGLNFQAFPHDSAGSVSTDWPAGQSIVMHEVAHSFGVHHKSNYNSVGLVSAEYGTGNSPIYVPVMGGGDDYNGSPHMVKFIYGQPNNSGTTAQDDLATIASALTGAGVTSARTTEPDFSADFGGSIGTAATLTSLGNNTFGRAGIVNSASDIDYFAFSPTVDGYYDILLGHDVSAIDTFLVIQNSSGTVLSAEGGNPWDPAVKRNTYDQHVTRFFTAGTYYIRVASEANYGDTGQYVVRASRVGDSSNPWRAEDIGFTAVPGYSSYNSTTGTYTFAGSGSDLARPLNNGSVVDNFHFLSQQLQGDGYLNARIASINGSNVWSEGGVMIRASLDPQSDFMSIAVTNGVGIRIRSRISGVISDDYVNFGAAFAPKHLSVERIGNTFKVYTSNTGLSGSWTNVGPIKTIAMPSVTLIGLFASDISDGLLSPLDGGNYPFVQNQRLAVVTATNILLTKTGTGVLNPNPFPNLNTFVAPTLVAGSLGANVAGSIAMTWNDVAGQTESGYILERSEDNVNWTTINSSITSTTFSYTDTSGLYGYGQYFYRIRAKKSDGTVSNPSNSISPVTRASAVTGIYPSVTGTNQITLKWDDVDGDAGYKVWRSTAQNGTYTQVGSTLAQNRTLLYDSSGKSANTTYWYKIETLDEFGAGGSMTAPFALDTRWTTSTPTGLTSPSKTSTTINLDWTNFSGATSYVVYRGRQANGAVEYVLAGSPTASAFNDSGLDPGIQYTYRVFAVASTGRMSYNATLSVTTNASGLRMAGSGVGQRMTSEWENRSAWLITPAQTSSSTSSATSNFDRSRFNLNSAIAAHTGRITELRDKIFERIENATSEALKTSSLSKKISSSALISTLQNEDSSRDLRNQLDDATDSLDCTSKSNKNLKDKLAAFFANENFEL